VPDVFDVLRHDHETVGQLLVALEDAPSAAEQATPAQLAGRRALAEQLVMTESRHEAGEEQYFWPTVRALVPYGDTLAEKAILQETAAKQLLHRLDGMSPEDPEFDELVRQLVPAAREHIAFEEQQVWPRLRNLLGAREAVALGDKIYRTTRLGPTRPHPNTPPRPGALKTVGMVAAVVDRMRDAMTNRGDPQS
jgi:hypothetical protein